MTNEAFCLTKKGARAILGKAFGVSRSPLHTYILEVAPNSVALQQQTG